MSNRIDIVGKTFGQLIITEYVGTSGKSSNWLAKCACGENIYITRKKLMKGKKSCGCLRSKPKYQNLFEKVIQYNRPDRKRFVYIASYREGFFKIGCTSDLGKRMLSLSNDFPEPIELACFVELNCASTLETALHIKYSHSQVPVRYRHGNNFSREFFRIDLELIVKDLESLGLEVVYD